MNVPSLMDKRGIKKLMAMIQVIKMGIEAHRFLKREKPQMVIGTGGYSSGPIVGVASLMGIPTAVHEQNAIPGMTNRLLARFVKKIFVAFERAVSFFPKKKTVWIGTPVREMVLAEAKGVDREESFVLLVLGGSLGARFINERMKQVLQSLADLRDQIHIVHQLGVAADVTEMESCYKKALFRAEVYPFIHNMGLHYGRARFVVARAGATGLAELIAVKRASLLIPYPHAAERHQVENAKVLVEAGGARMCEESQLSVERLANEIRWAVTHREELKKMEQSLEKLSSGSVAETMAEACLKMMEA